MTSYSYDQFLSDKEKEHQGEPAMCSFCSDEAEYCYDDFTMLGREELGVGQDDNLCDDCFNKFLFEYFKCANESFNQSDFNHVDYSKFIIF